MHLPMATGLAAPPFWLFFSHSTSHILLQISSLHSLSYFHSLSDPCPSKAKGADSNLPQVMFSQHFFFFPSLSILIEKNWKVASVLIRPPLCFLLWEHFLTQVRTFVQLREEAQHISALFLQFNGRALAPEGSYTSPAPCCQKSLNLYPVTGCSTTTSCLSPLQCHFVSCGDCHRRCFCLDFSPSLIIYLIQTTFLNFPTCPGKEKKAKKMWFVKRSMWNKDNLVSGRRQHLFSLHLSCCCLSCTNACITPFLLSVEIPGLWKLM